jgi:hypothetical protein
LLDHLGTSSIDNEIEDHTDAATMTTPSRREVVDAVSKPMVRRS